jgi:hypothetical protein
MIQYEGIKAVYLPNPEGPGSLQTVDLRYALPEPPRSKGTITVFDAESFHAAVKQRMASHEVPAYADDQRLTLTAVLNDDEHLHEVPTTADEKGGHTLTGWRDYRVVLALRPTMEWANWKSHDGAAFPQAHFAEFIEDMATMIVEPEPATMLEIAQTLQGTLKASWSAGHRLSNGARQLTWSETVNASAGDSGKLEIPASFLIACQLFRGGPVVQVRAMFRFRIGPPLTLHYKLLEVDRLEREAFQAVLGEVKGAEGHHVTVLQGPAPEVTTL